MCAIAILKPRQPTVKALFAVSGNTCTYTGCEEALTDPKWLQVNADIAHIMGEKRGAARFDDSMSDEDRRHYDNLFLLCPKHHRLIDRLDPNGHPPELLRRMKDQHEGRAVGARKAWTTDEELARFAALAIASFVEAMSDEGSPIRQPRLVVDRSNGDSVDIVNQGDADASNLRVEPLNAGTESALVLADIPPGRISPGGSWRAGVMAIAVGDEGPFVVRLSYQDDQGDEYQGEFPV